ARASAMSPRVESLLHRTYARYLFALATAAAALGLRLLLSPLTGRGAPFAIFFAAVVATALFAGAGPGLCTLLVSISLAAYFFVLPARNTVPQAGFQALLYLVDGLVILYLTSLMNRRRRTLDDTNRALRRLRDEAARAEARARDVIELAPDAFFLADLDGRFTDVNQAACRLLGYERDELIGKTIFDIIPAEDAARLKAVRTELLVPGKIDKAEWTQRRKEGSLVPVEMSSNILPDGRWQAFFRDISDERRIADDREHLLASERKARRETEATNAQLRESEERF